MAARVSYRVDPNDPRAPTMDIWDALSEEQRRSVIDALPSEVEASPPPEGDLHRIPKQRALEALDAFFRRTRRRVYLSSELPVYYPGESMFAPDLIAVLDAEPHERMRWVVADEGKGPDLALEVTLYGSRHKDLEFNVERYARLGIPEYFVFDRRERRLHGWRLAGRERYEPVVPQLGRWGSAVLGLELVVEEERVRFYSGSAVLPELHDLLTRANLLVDGLQDRIALAEQRAELAERRAEEQKARAEEQKARAELAERRTHALEEELEQLRRERD